MCAAVFVKLTLYNMVMQYWNQTCTDSSNITENMTHIAAYYKFQVSPSLFFNYSEMNGEQWLPERWKKNT